MLVQQFRYHHDEAGRAIATLEGARLNKGLLHGAELAVCVEALDGRHAGTIDEYCQIEAARDWVVIDDDRAAAAQTLAAAFACAGKAELCLEQLNEIVVRFDV